MAGAGQGPRPWRQRDSRTVYSDRWITLRSDTVETADGRIVAPFHVLEFGEWVAVVAITPAGELVAVREYRHGAGEVIFGLPAGVVDPGEAPEAGARRELLEETGFAADIVLPLPPMWANAPNQTNRAWHFLAPGARPGGETSFDPTEDIQTVLVDFIGFYRDLREGRLMMTGLHVAALHQAAAFILGSERVELAGLRHRLAESLGLSVK